MNRREFLKTTAGAAVMTGVIGQAARADTIRVGLVAKSLGSEFFVAVNKGAREAAAAIGGVEVVLTGPTTTSAEGQIESIQALIDQHFDAIAISANDPDALVPVCKRALARGIKVISFDSGVSPGGRIVHVAPSSSAMIGASMDQIAASVVPNGKVKFAIVSATPTSTNQNEWIAVMKKDLAQYPNLELLSVVYGNDLADDSYREATALLQKYPEMNVILSPSTVGLVASAKAIEDSKNTGRVFATGIGLPSECAAHIAAGSMKSFAIWNPIDLGYCTIEVAVDLVRGAKGPGETLKIGRMGTISFDADGVGAMAKPVVYDKTNVAQFAKVF